MDITPYCSHPLCFPDGLVTNMAITGADSSYCHQQKYLIGMNSVAVTKQVLYDLLFRYFLLLGVSNRLFSENFFVNIINFLASISLKLASLPPYPLRISESGLCFWCKKGYDCFQKCYYIRHQNMVCPKPWLVHRQLPAPGALKFRQFLFIEKILKPLKLSETAIIHFGFCPCC